MNLRTLCFFALFSLPVFCLRGQVIQSENFDSCSLPAGWTNQATGSNAAASWIFVLNSPDPNNAGNIDSTCMALFDDDDIDMDGGEIVELISPPVDISGYSSVVLEFDYNYRHLGGSSFSVDVWDGSAWQNVLMETTGDNCGAWTCGPPYPRASINVTPYLNAAFQVRFTYNDGNGWNWWASIDNYVLQVADSCIAPVNLNAINITQTQADLTWGPGDLNSTSWNLEWMLTGFPQGTGTVVPGVSNPYTLTGLTPNTAYDFYVQEICGANDTSAFNGPFTFSTLSVISSFPSCENFDGFNLCGNSASSCVTDGSCASTSIFTSPGWLNAFGDDIDWSVNTGATPSADTGPDSYGDHTSGSGNYLFTEASGGCNGQTGNVVTPAYDLSPLTNPIIEFWYHMLGGDMGDLSLDIESPAGSGTWTTLRTISGNQGDEWKVISTDLSAYSGATVRFRFRGVTGLPDAGAGWESDMAIDDICVKEAPTCPRPDSVQVSGITDSSVVIDWASGNPGAGFTIQYEFMGIDSQANGIVGVDGPPYTLYPLGPGRTYEFTIWEDCGGGDISDTVGSFQFNTAFANPLSVCGIEIPITDDGCPENDVFLIDVSGAGGDSLGTDVVLTDVDIVIDHTWVSDLEIRLQSPSGTIVDLSIAHGGSGDNYGIPDSCPNLVTNFNMRADTLIGNGTPPFLGSYVPEESFAGFNDNSDPNGVWQLLICDGAFLDDGNLHYANLTFGPPPTCDEPSGLTVTTITETSAVLSWTPGDTATTLWNIEYMPRGVPLGSGTRVMGVGNPYVLSGLTPSTAYQYYVQEDCVVDTSFFVGPFSFSTLTIITTFPACENFDAFTLCGNSAFDCVSDQSCYASFTSPGWLNAPGDDIDWSVNTGATPSGGTGPSADHTSGSGNYLFTEASGCAGQTGIVSSPAYDLSTLTSPEIDFWYHLFGGDVGSLVLDIENPAGSGNWTNLFIDSVDRGDTWNRSIIDISSYAGDTVAFRFVGVTGSAFESDMAFDDFCVQEKPTCPDPLNLSAGNASEDSVDVTWTSSAVGATYTIEWGIVGFTPGGAGSLGTASGTSVTGTNTVRIGGLSPSKFYEVYVQEDCGGGNLSVNAGPASFVTLGNPTVCGLNVDIPDDGCPSNSLDFPISVSGAGGTALGTDIILTDVDIVIEHTWDADLDISLESPNGVLIDLSVFNGGSGDNYGDPNDVTCSITANFNMQGLDGPVTSGAAPFIGSFVPEGNFSDFNDGSDPNGIWILHICDDAFLDQGTLEYASLAFGPPPSCPNPSGLAVVSLLPTSANLAWTAGDSSLTWVVEYGPAGFTPGTGSVLTGSYTGVLDTATAGGLIPETAYDCYVQDVCDPGNDSSQLRGPVTFITPPVNDICAGAIPISCGDTINDSTVNATVDASLGVCGPTSHSTSPGEYYVFTGSGEGVIASLCGSAYDTKIGVFQGPCGALSCVDGNDDSCGLQSQVEFTALAGVDYYIYVSGFGGATGDYTLSLSCYSCPNPFDLAATNITQTSVDLEWLSANVGSDYILEYGPAGFIPGFGVSFTNTVPSSNPSVSIGGLTPATAYDWYLQEVCGGDATARLAGSFTTAIPNPSPCGLDFALQDASCPAEDVFQVEVTNTPGDSLGVNVGLAEVRLVIAHTWDSDLEISLESPNGVVIPLSITNGSSGDNYGNPGDTTCSATTNFNTCAPVSITDGFAPFIGDYRPEGLFSDFNDGSDPNGTWRLRICDGFAGDVGTLEFIELVFQSLPVPVDAGPDQALCITDSVALMNANAPNAGQGIWSVITGSGTFSDVHDPQATVTGFSTGINSYVWTISNGICPALKDTVDVGIYPLPAVSITNLEPYYCTADSPVILIGDPPGGTFNGTGVVNNILDPAIVPVGGPFNITYNYVDSNGCSNSVTKQYSMRLSPTVELFGLNTEYCEDAPAAVMTGTPPGGVFSGPGISGNTFVPFFAGPGTHNISYTYVDANTCPGTDGATVRINPLPVIHFDTLQSAYCVNDDTVSLNATPAGGVFSGTGVVNGGFDPFVAGVGGPYVITYTYVDSNGCESSVDQHVLVYDKPNVTILNLASSYCTGDNAVTLSGVPSGGTFSGPGISGNTFDPDSAGAGQHTIVYTFSNGNGCSGSDSIDVTIFSSPAVRFGGLDTNYCYNDPASFLIGDPPGGVFSGGNVIGNVFDPTVSGTGTFDITYEYTDVNGCSGSETQTTTVHPLPLVTISGLDSSYCLSDGSVQLMGTPTGGTFSGPGITGNEFDPANAGVGTHVILYYYEDATGTCADLAKVFVRVAACTGIAYGGDFPEVLLYPNPTSGVINVEISGRVDKDIQLSIIDLSGKTIYAEQIPSDGWNRIDQIDLSNVARGMYIVKLQSGSMTYMDKIVVHSR